MSNMKAWAEREIEIACKRERGDKPEDEWDYGCACYESALKAFNSLMEDGHSGFSIGMTKQILNRLIDGKPLTPIEDTEDVWINITEEYGLSEEGGKKYQCKRMSSLFKDVAADGSVRYSDTGRYYCADINNPDSSYTCGIVRKVIDDMFPIKMPYMPNNKPIKVYCEEFLTDRKNGDFDTVGVLYAIMPDGGQVQINRYFGEVDRKMVAINNGKYEARRALANERIEKEKNDNQE